MGCNNVPNADGSFDCTLELSDGTTLAYVSFRVDGVYPEGIGCNPSTGQLYAFDSVGHEVPLGAVVSIQTGAITRTPTGGLAPPTNLTVVGVS